MIHAYYSDLLLHFQPIRSDNVQCLSTQNNTHKIKGRVDRVKPTTMGSNHAHCNRGNLCKTSTPHFRVSCGCGEPGHHRCKKGNGVKIVDTDLYHHIQYIFRSEDSLPVNVESKTNE